MLLGCMIGISGGAVTLTMDYKTMLLGRGLLGIAMGMFIVTKYRYLEEYIPYQIFEVCATLAFLMTILGVYLGNCSSYFLPDDALEEKF